MADTVVVANRMMVADNKGQVSSKVLAD